MTKRNNRRERRRRRFVTRAGGLELLEAERLELERARLIAIARAVRDARTDAAAVAALRYGWLEPARAADVDAAGDRRSPVSSARATATTRGHAHKPPETP